MGARALPRDAREAAPTVGALDVALRHARAKPRHVLTLDYGGKTAQVRFERGEYVITQGASTWRTLKTGAALDALFYLFPQGATLRGK